MLETFSNSLMQKGARQGLALFILRVCAGGFLAFLHGWPKLMGMSEMAVSFPDPLHIGSQPSLFLVIFGELICGILIMLGAWTRLATIPAIITMFVAAFFVHGNDGLLRQEPALFYLIVFVVITIGGPGRFALDSILQERKRFFG
jgi:putative oxidoreductase